MKNIGLVILVTIFVNYASANISNRCTDTTSTTTKYVFQLENEAKSFQVRLCVDDAHFYTHQLESIADAGASIYIFADHVSLYTYQVENMAKHGVVTYVLGKKSLYSYQLESLVKAGVNVEIRASRTDYYTYQLISMASADPSGKGKLVLHMDTKRFYDYEIENLRNAGAVFIYE